MTLRARIRVVAMVVAAFLVGLMARVPEDEHAPRREKRDLRAAAAVHEIARLEKQRTSLRGDLHTLAKRLEASEKDRARLERELAGAAPAPEVQDLAQIDGPRVVASSVVIEAMSNRIRYDTVRSIGLLSRAQQVDIQLGERRSVISLASKARPVRIVFAPPAPAEQR